MATIRNTAGSAESTSAKANTAGYFWSLFSLGMVVAAIGPSLPDLASSTGVSLGAVGLALSAYRFGYMAGSLGGGAALDRFRGNRTLAAGLATMAVSLSIVPILPTLAFLLAAFVLVGVAGGVVEVGGNTLLIWVYRERVGPWMSALHFAFGIGAMLTPFLIGQSLRLTGGILPAYLGAALLMVPGLVVLLLARSPAAPPGEESGGDRTDLPMVALVALFLLFYIGAESSVGGWIYAWSLAVHGISPTRAATLTSLFWATVTGGRLLAIPLASRVTPRTILIGTVVGACASLLLIASPAGRVSEAVAWIAVAGAGLSMAAVFPMTMSFAGRHMRITGSSSRWFFVAAGAGGMTIPWVMGRLMDGAGPGAVMPAILGVLLLMGATLVVLLARVRQTRRR